MACLSRGLIGILSNKDEKPTMVVCLPGKPKAIKENMEILMRNGILIHAILLMRNRTGHWIDFLIVWFNFIFLIYTLIKS